MLQNGIILLTFQLIVLISIAYSFKQNKRKISSENKINTIIMTVNMTVRDYYNEYINIFTQNIDPSIILLNGDEINFQKRDNDHCLLNLHRFLLLDMD